MKQKSPWESSNFWIAVVLAVGGLFVGFPQDEARWFVEALFGIVASVGLIREKVKNTSVDWKAWLRSVNTWNYLAAAVVALIPAIPSELFVRLRDLADASLSGNWQGIITALFSIGTIIYYTVTKPKPAVR